MQRSVTRRRTDRGSILLIEVPGMQLLNWKLHRQKLHIISSSGYKKQIGKKRNWLITSIISRIFVLSFTIFED